MTDRPSQPPSAGQVQLHTVRIESAVEGIVKVVRALSRSYGGLFTHRVKGRPVYCQGRECNPQHHRGDRFWRGYFAAELFDAEKRLWLPCVWELTQNSECDIRERYKRGLVWEMVRKDIGTSKNPPATCTLYGSYPESVLPAEFDYRVVLQRCYNLAGLDLSQKNPMPPRLVLLPSPPVASMELLSEEAKARQAEAQAKQDWHNRVREAQKNGKPSQAAKN